MSGCLKGTHKKYDRQIGFDMRGFILSLFMLNGKDKLINWSALVGVFNTLEDMHQLGNVSI